MSRAPGHHNGTGWSDCTSSSRVNVTYALVITGAAQYHLS